MISSSNKDKIILMGTHGTGKTTALKYFESQGYFAFPEIARELIKSMGRTNQEEFQKQLYIRKKEQLKQFLLIDKKAVMDRTVLDVLLYSQDFGVPSGEESSAVEMLKHPIFSQHKENIQFFYFPVTEQNKNWIIDDTEREEWEKESSYIGDFRNNLDQHFAQLYNKMKLNGFFIDIWKY